MLVREDTVFPPSFLTHSAYWPEWVLIIVIVAVLWYRTRKTGLNKIPTVGYSAPLLSYITAFRFNANGHELLQEGYDKYKPGLFKIAMWDQWFVTATGTQLISDILKAPDDVLSINQGIYQFLQAEYTMGPSITQNPYHIPLILSQLTRRLSGILDDIHSEVVAAFHGVVPEKSSEWIKLSPQLTVEKIICRVSNRVFVGAPTYLDDGYQRLNIEFAVNVLQRARKISRFPGVLHPIVGPLLTTLPSQLMRQTKYLAPIIEERRKQLQEHGDDWEKPNDMLMWLMETAQEEELSTANLARRILVLNFTSIHTSSKTFTYALYDLAANPEMHKVDSFLRESQRIHGLNFASMRRVALKPFTFSNGVTIPAGTTVACCTKPVHQDSAIYDHPDVFDPLRFIDVRKDQGPQKMVSTSLDYLPFSHGPHACPGRFFVSAELKTMLAHIVVSYDVKFEDGQGFPPDRFMAESCIPGPAMVMFRKRRVAD
ncbi:cytochrome P450 [Artomyces pyxidatus]|uniref:Cytochrome P450 n=1 Tax=Artomyces pyxidatus TaxID=48021 RepID=A0ACB8SVN5_9AGAM|nr:cytochrome P450 [Artomyces pyxidatus]